MSASNILSELDTIVGQLHHLSDELITVIDKQIDAVVSAEPDQIEEYVETYTNLKGVFKKQEHKFINHLQKTLDNAEIEDIEVRLEDLKKVYPESENRIDEWQKSLERQMSTLKKKHQKLVELLEFAVDQNMSLMHSIYQLHNKKNTRYGAKGNKEEISSGIALNKQA